MQFNKKTTSTLIAVGVLIGAAAVVSSQVRAQSAAHLSTPQAQATIPASADKVTPADTDNIQDPGGVEQVDAGTNDTVDTKDTKGADIETNDDKGQSSTTQDAETNDGPDSASGQ